MESEEAARLDRLTEAVAELQAGQAELLRMFEEAREGCTPKGCWYRTLAEAQGKADVLAFDLFGNPTIEGEPEIWQQ